MKEDLRKKRMALDYLLAQIFGDVPNELATYLTEKLTPPVPEVPKEVIPLVKFVSQPTDNRFKAVRDKLASQPQAVSPEAGAPSESE